MTVSSEQSSVTYTGNGVTTLFAIPYYFLEKTHILVTLTDAAGVVIPKVLNIDYTVAGAGNEAGGSLTFLVAPPNLSNLIIARNVPATQLTEYRPNDDFPAESHERALDKLTMISQQVSAGLGSVNTQIGKTVRTPEAIPALPDAASRVNKILTFDGFGNPIADVAASGSAIELAIDLAYPFDPAKGSGMIGHDRRVPNASKRNTVDFYLATKKVSFWEYEKYLSPVDKPDPGNPDGWNWTSAFAQAGQLGKILQFTSGTFLGDSFVVYPGTFVEGEGGGMFNPRTILKSRAAGTKMVTSAPSSSSIQRDSFGMEGIKVISDFAITCGDPTKLIQDAGGTSAYEMRTHIKRCSAEPLTPSTGYGCLVAKNFNHQIDGNDFTRFARGIVELGSDNGSISFNRIVESSEYGLLQLSAGNFGSGTTIDTNELLSGLAGSTYFKTTGRHVRVKNLYLERTPGVTVKGFIDVSTIDAPTYGPNVVPASTYFSVDIGIDRIDGEAQATDFINRCDPIGYSTKIHSLGTAGVKNSTLPWLTVVGDGVPLFSISNPTNATLLRFEFVGSGERRWAEFKPESLRTAKGGVSFNHLSLPSLNPAELRRNNAFLHVLRNDHAILLKSTLSTTLFHCILPTLTVDGVDINNPWLRNGVSYTVTVTARMVSGTGTLRCLKIVDAASQGVAVDTALTTQWQKITMTMTGVAATSKVGIAFAHNAANTTNIEIDNVSFEE